MTLAEAMKSFLCVIKNDGTTPEQITQNNAADLWEQIVIWFEQRFNVTVPTLTVTSQPGPSEMGTIFIVQNAEPGYSYRYLVDVRKFPASLDDLSDWPIWDGESELIILDGSAVCVAQVDNECHPVKACIITANSNIDY